MQRFTWNAALVRARPVIRRSLVTAELPRTDRYKARNRDTGYVWWGLCEGGLQFVRQLACLRTRAFRCGVRSRWLRKRKKNTYNYRSSALRCTSFRSMADLIHSKHETRTRRLHQHSPWQRTAAWPRRGPRHAVAPLGNARHKTERRPLRAPLCWPRSAGGWTAPVGAVRSAAPPASHQRWPVPPVTPPACRQTPLFLARAATLLAAVRPVAALVVARVAAVNVGGSAAHVRAPVAAHGGGASGPGTRTSTSADTGVGRRGVEEEGMRTNTGNGGVC